MPRAHRVSPWFNDRVLPLIALFALIADVTFGIILAVAPRTEFRSPIWGMAMQVTDLQTWGVLLVTLALMTSLVWWVQGRCRLASFLLLYALGTGYWMFWSILALWSSFGPNGTTGAMAVLSTFLGACHVVAGLAWPASCPPLPRK